MVKKFAAIIILSLVLSGIGSLNSYGQEEISLPIPEFNGPINPGYSSERNALTNEALGAAFHRMREHLCHKPNPVTNDWQNKFDDLLVNLIIGEYRLAWLNLSNFNSTENSIYEQFKTERRKIRTRLSDKVAKNPELQAVIDEYDKAQTNLYLNHNNEFGRAVFTIHSELFFDRTFPAKVRLSPQKLRDLGMVEEVAAFHSKMIEFTAQLHKRLHERGITETNKIIPRNAIFPFSIHQTPNHLKQRVLERLITEFQGLGVRLGDKETAIPIYESNEWTTHALFNSTVFDSSQQDLLRGNCKNGAKRWKSVRIVYDPSRSADAQRARDLLREKGFTVTQLWERRSEISEGHNQKLYFFSSVGATPEEAGEIVKIVKNIERIVPNESKYVSSDSVEYVLWINTPK